MYINDDFYITWLVDGRIKTNLLESSCVERIYSQVNSVYDYLFRIWQIVHNSTLSNKEKNILLKKIYLQIGFDQREMNARFFEE